MSSSSLVDFIEQWQTGFFLLVGMLVVSVGAGIAARSVVGPPGLVVGMLVGALAVFLGYSYLRYGR
ncbi:hypothetical protein [Salinigranum salinum]|jgi:fructose-specific phosphotransferase system IIC component|uniref:hypothetical protein n=1 Tax=Salinigranum salinum TaxID=1364937 RepID=UPI001260F946|nr:hypothetical protein [Salinigranum salinum]